MIARRELTPEHHAFNNRWGAPSGRAMTSVRSHLVERLADRFDSFQMHAKARGPFGFQPYNNATRRAEYPWAATAVPVRPGMRVVDVGGSLGGLQFVLARQGATVINVDPSESAAMGWSVDHKTIGELNKAFGTNVELRKAFLQDASLEAASVDTVYCISTIEHIPASEIPPLVREIARVLKPGGSAVLTVDLFFDLVPFTPLAANVHGTNIDVAWLVRESGLELVAGDRSELYGYPEFDPLTVLSRAMEFAQGDIALNVAQTLVLRKPA